MISSSDKPIFSSDELARALRITDSTLTNWRNQGLPHEGASRCPYYYRAGYVLAWLEVRFAHDRGRYLRYRERLLEAMKKEHREHYEEET